MSQTNNIKKIQLKRSTNGEFEIKFKGWFSSTNQCIENTNLFMNGNYTKNGVMYFNSEGTGLKVDNAIIVNGNLNLDRIIFGDSTSTSIGGLTKETADAHINSTGANVHSITAKTIDLEKLGKEESIRAFYEKPMSDKTEELYSSTETATKNGYVINSDLTKNNNYLANIGAILNYMPTFLSNFRNRAYPVGSYYMNTRNSTNPNTLLGFGTWTLINTTCTLMSAGTNYSVGATGGSNTATLTINNIPQHTHSISIEGNDNHTHGRGSLEATGSMWGNRFGSSGNCGVGGCFSGSVVNGGDVGATNSQGNSVRTRFTGSRNWSGNTSSSGGHAHTITLANQSSGGTSFNIMKPYLVVYIWRRTA